MENAGYWIVGGLLAMAAIGWVAVLILHLRSKRQES